MTMGFGLRRALSRRMVSSAEESDVRPGDRFLERGRTTTVWEVERILQPRGEGLPHAVITDAQRRNERRLVACNALLDRQRFARDRSDASAA